MNGRTYRLGFSSRLQQITLARHDPHPNWDLPCVDPFGYGHEGVLSEFQANSSAHDSDKAISAYSLAINDNSHYYHFVMGKDTFMAFPSMILQLTLDESPNEVVKNKFTRKNWNPKPNGFEPSLIPSNGMPPRKIKD